MNENFNTTLETPEFDEGAGRANPSSYLDRTSATILMVIKLAEGLSKLCLAILGAFVLQTVVTSLNRIFQEGTTVADGKAMVAQFLKTLRVPTETIQQIVDAFPLNITFSSKPVVYVFVICLPFVLIAVLEAIAAIRLRLGKGGTRTIGILQMIYYVLDALKLLVFALCAIAMSIIIIIRLGGPASIMLSTIFVSLAVFYILISLPTLLYHRNIAKIMGDIRYEMQTGRQAARRQTHFKKILITLIVLEVIGAVVSIAASWSPKQGGVIAALIIAALIGPLVKLLKYICVMCCYRNYMREDGTVETERNVSHTPQIIMIVLVVLFFAIPNIFLCLQASAFSDTIVEKVEEFFGDARQTVDELSVVAEEQITAVQSQIEDAQSQIEAAAQVASENAADAPQGETKAEKGEAAASQQNAAKEEAGDAAPEKTAAPAEDTANKENSV